jgi:hypothetical protein
MGEDDGKHSRILCLDAARYTVAAVVSALTVAVIVGAIFVSLRPEKLDFRVANGYVSVDKIISMSPPVNVTFHLMVKGHNPSGRVGIRLRNTTVHFLYNNSASSEITWFDGFPLNTFNVAPQIERHSYLMSISLQAPSEVPMDFVRKMVKGVEIKNATVLLKGLLETQISGLNHTHSARYTNNFCSPVIIGTSTSPKDEMDDTP